MSLFSNPQEHAANPPETWTVTKTGTRWYLCTASGGTLGSYERKRDAEEDKRTGHWVRLYRDETRWYAGGSVPGWKSYAQMLAES